MKKVDGVKSVNVSLNEGVAVVELRDGNRVTVEQVQQIIKKNGFTPKAVQIVGAGTLVERGGRPALEVSGIDSVYLLVEHPEAKGKLAGTESLIGKSVVITGDLAEPDRDQKQAPPVLQVRSIEGRK
jgi:NAD-dependent DNA ligase